MKSLNIKFQEKYKDVDKFIKDAYGSTEGISEYLRRMDANSKAGAAVSSWDEDYRMLKHLRWIRNKLAHEVSIESDICEKKDFEWLCDFEKRLAKGDDSLAVLSLRHKKSQRGKTKSKAAPTAAHSKHHSNKNSGRKKNSRKVLIGIAVLLALIAVAVLAVKLLP